MHNLFNSTKEAQLNFSPIAIRRKILRIVITAILVCVSIATILPFLWMLSTSFKYNGDVFNYPIEWIPKRNNGFNNYIEVLSSKYNIGLYYLNTIKVSILATIAQILVSAMSAYALAKIKFKYSNIIFLTYLGTMMIPEQVILVPRFMIYRWLGLFDSHTGLIILLSFSVFGTFMLRQHMVTIPDSLVESAKIDGASHFAIFSKIILPLSKPAIATLATLKFIWTWNDYQHPLIFISSKEKFLLQQGIRQFATEDGQFYALIMAAAVLAIVPLLVVFISGQKYVVEGITSGAVKG